MTFAELEQDRVEEFKRSTERKLREVRCPRHRQLPRLHFHGARLREITISLTGCCPELMKLANAAVGRSDRAS